MAAHPYAKKKGIGWAAAAGVTTATGRLIGRDAHCIVVPMRTYPGQQLCGVEVIAAGGRKQTFGHKGVLVVGNDLNPTLVQHVVEGWATGVRHLANFDGNAAVYVSFGKSRLDQVAHAVEKAHPNRDIVIWREADNA